MGSLNLIQKIFVWAIPVLFAITLHEVAHGWLANKLGDGTARMLGRITLNPLKHIDPIGTIALPLLLIILPYTNFVFGWAKPVPVNWNNLRHPRRDMALVALAGPVANFLMACFWALCIKFAMILASSGIAAALILLYMGVAGILINLVLMALNLLPLPPLDGSRVVSSLLPPRLAWSYNRIEPYGFIILIALLALNILGTLIYPIFTLFLELILQLFAIPPQVISF